MSSIVKLSLLLISPTGLLPKDIMMKTFSRALNEVRGTIEDGVLMIQNQKIGKVLCGERIVVQTMDDSLHKTAPLVEALRKVFTHKSSIEIANYQFSLNQEKLRLQQTENDLIQLEKNLKLLEEKLATQNKAVLKQNMSSCDAMIEELKEAAIQQGYEIIESKNEEQIQLQFVRIEY